jgi:hypothetical protein
MGTNMANFVLDSDPLSIGVEAAQPIKVESTGKRRKLSLSGGRRSSTPPPPIPAMNTKRTLKHFVASKSSLEEGIADGVTAINALQSGKKVDGIIPICDTPPSSKMNLSTDGLSSLIQRLEHMTAADNVDELFRPLIPIAVCSMNHSDCGEVNCGNGNRRENDKKRDYPVAPQASELQYNTMKVLKFLY